MAKKKKLGHGTIVNINAVDFLFLEEVTPAEVTRDVVDVTCLDDTAVDSLDSDPPDYGSVAFQGFYDPGSTEDEAIRTFMTNDDISEREATILVKYRLAGTGTAPAASTWTYKTITYIGRLTKFAPQKVKSKEKMLLSVEMKVNQKPVIA